MLELVKRRFRWKRNVEYDIALLSETESFNPFVTKKNADVWKQVATKLKESQLKMPVTDRSCRERVQKLLEQFRQEEEFSSIQNDFCISIYPMYVLQVILKL